MMWLHLAVVGVLLLGACSSPTDDPTDGSPSVDARADAEADAVGRDRGPEDDSCPLTRSQLLRSTIGPVSAAMTTLCAGNGFVEPGETCDDENRIDGDGCSAAATVEAGYVCFSEPSRCVEHGAGNFYYVDYEEGSDENSGRSPAEPWQHAPGMEPFDGDYTHRAGGRPDHFIFKGGVTWPRDALPLLITAGGAGPESRTYYTVDRSWYSGAAWSPPLFDAEGKPFGAWDIGPFEHVP